MHAAEQRAAHRLDQRVALSVVKDVAHERARLAEVVVLGVQRVRAAHHLAIGLPPVLGRPGARRTTARPPLFGAYTGALPACS